MDIKTKSWSWITSLTVIFLSLIFLNGCQTYSESENKVYQFASSLKNSIPKELEKNGDRYEDDHENFTKLIVRFVERSPLTVGRAKLNDSTGTLIFMHVTSEDNFTDYADEGFMLLNSVNATFYLRKSDVWKKGTCAFDGPEDNLRQLDDCINNILESGAVINASSVKRYLKLSDRIRETYFQEENNDSE